MSTKIFPMRPAPNPHKGRVTDGLPNLPIPSAEDKKIMRDLMRERAEAALAKRAEALPSPAPKLPPIEVMVWGFEPGFVIAYAEHTTRATKRFFSSGRRAAMVVAYEFLTRFRKREPAKCRVCDLEITASKDDRVPYGVYVWQEARQPIRAAGLCLECAAAPSVKLTLTGEGRNGKTYRVRVKVMEWMETSAKHGELPTEEFFWE